MGLKLCLGLLMLLLGSGAIQGQSFSENSTEEQYWPKLEVLKYLRFSCKPRKLMSNISSVSGVSVNTLRPSDVKFVASIGIEGTLLLSSTVGVMKKLNMTEEVSQELCLGVGRDIIRFSNSTVLRPLCIPRREMTSWTDAEHLWMEATELVRSMKENVQLDFENDWKLINVFISNANECYLCPVDGQKSFVRSAMKRLTKTLDYLYQEVPRSFVNLVDLTDVLEFTALPEMGTQGSNKSEFCRCSEEMVKYKAFSWQSYKEIWEWVLASSKYNQEESFALVFQPFFYETDLTPVLMEQSLQDPTELGVHLWNSMMEPAGEKEIPYNARMSRLVKCPSKEHPYMFTYRNSNYQPSLPKIHPVFQPKQVQLQCPDKTPSGIVPQSVHKLKPADINIVAAVGDSLMANAEAGFRPQNFNSVFDEYRGLSWSTLGGNETLENVITLPNILRQFNSKLTDYTLGHGNTHSAGARLNQTVEEVISMDMSNQVSEVIRKMKSDRKINYKNDWKLLTMFIRGNDLCHSCNEKLNFSTKKFQDNIQSALDILHREVPRMIVNVVSPMEITSLRAVYEETGNQCPQDQLMKLCPCVMEFGEGSQEYAQVVTYNKQYQKILDMMVKSGRYDTRDDFTVVLQPFFENFEMPRTEEGLPDLTYFDGDCFHFSQKTLGHAASALWNNMLEPVGQKSRQHNFTSNIVFSCPTQEQPFLRTSKNSAQRNASRLPCHDMTPSGSTPSSVNSVKAADIKIIAALGDFFISGRAIGAVTFHPPSFSFDFRGLSFSIGGDMEFPQVKTLPNILRQFNSNIKGYSLKVAYATEDDAKLNQAVTNAKLRTLLEQSKTLVNKMKSFKNVQYADDWKVITIMIGNQDLCNYCHNKEEYSAENFTLHIKNSLDYLQTNVPRAVVNLLFFFDPFIIRQLFQTLPEKCGFNYRSQCSCVLMPQESSPDVVNLEELTIQYQNGLKNLIWSGRYDTRENFTVVLQPFLETVHNTIHLDGTADNTFFTPNCLFLNKRAHGKLAYALWNNMFEALGNKTTEFNLNMDDPLTCPGERQSVPFLRTKKNSNYTYPRPIEKKEWGTDFHCDYVKVAESFPSSVHKIQPADITVVAAMGDWVTTARGASPYTSGQTKSWKSLSWSIGGHRSLDVQATLPNILLKFSSIIRGMSIGSWPELSGLNVAEDEARTENMPSQAIDLLKLMELNPDIDVNNDWKLITIFIGINDLCDFCMNQTIEATKKFQKYMLLTLDILSKKLPRTYINLVEVMDVLSFYDKRGGKCGKMPLKCPCFASSNSDLRAKVKKINTEFQRELYRISFREEYHLREDFVVVTQPFFRESTLPQNSDGESDPSYFSEDCRYFSARLQSEMAIALWNNMLEPVGKKSTFISFSTDRIKLKCPSEHHPYFYTQRNSVNSWVIWFLAFIIIVLSILLVAVIILKYCRRTSAPIVKRSEMS